MPDNASMETLLQGRIALVTGAAGDIGAAIVRRFVAAGARVAARGREGRACRRMAWR